MARHRRDRLTELAAGRVASFWILLAGVSGVYLFSALTNPAALGGQLANPLPVGSRRDDVGRQRLWTRATRSLPRSKRACAS